MANVFKFPDVGEGITEGEVKNWLVDEGNDVQEDEALLEVETDKAVVELPSPYSGTLLKRNVAKGKIVKVEQPLATIGEPGEEMEERPPEEEVEEKGPEEKGASPEKEALATPKVRKLAEEKGVDLSPVEGTGPEGRVTTEDVEAAAGEEVEEEEEKEKAAKVTRKYDMYGYIDRREMKGVRKTTAERMTEAAQAPLVTHQDEADITELVEVREHLKQEQDHLGAKLTYMPFIVKAAIEGLKTEPTLNSELTEDESELIIKKYYNVGVAVATENGLIVPNVKRAEEKTLVEIGEEIAELAEKTRDRSVDLAELKGGSLTITNYGAIGGTYGTQIPNPPETTILGVGKIMARPRVIDGELEPCKVLPLSVTEMGRNWLIAGLSGVAAGSRQLRPPKSHFHRGPSGPSPSVIAHKSLSILGNSSSLPPPMARYPSPVADDPSPCPRRDGGGERSF